MTTRKPAGLRRNGVTDCETRLAAEVETMARIFWIIGTGFALLALLLMANGGPEMGGIIDYRAWLLLVVGILAVVIGNFSQTSGHGG